MAEILFGLAAEILKSLGSLDIEEIVSIYGLDDELDKLSDIASSIQAVLIDAEEQQGSSNLVRNWIKRFKKVFFEADDLLDDVITEVKHRKLFHKSVQLNLDRETYSFVCDGEVIGRSDDKKKIADFLLDSKVEENVVVISIVEKIVKSGRGKKDNYLQLDAVQNELRKMLNGKKYLLVLDDVWNEDPLKWSRLKNMLIGVAKGSKILLTTHSDVVVEVSGSVHQHKLGDLSEEKTWTLFEKMAFGCNKESKNSNLVEIGKEIVRKCGAVPLAISNSTLERMISSFSRLQALHLGNLDIEFLPQSFGGLKHLRYLSVSSESIVTLPISITKLHNLQVLKLDDCRELKNLPRDIWRLLSLRHLLSVEFEYGNKEEEDTRDDMIMLEVLQPHQNIEGLGIRNYRGSRFPSWLMVENLDLLLPKLVHLYIKDFHKCQKLPPLWTLPSLHSLGLQNLGGLEVYDDKFMQPSKTPTDECYYLYSLKQIELQGITEKILTQIFCPPHL
ncbi:hypothetical protein T459_07294 [Capsicum annuum]|uniref:Disease resistance protein RGA3 n=1 Tax=Capsicum annuum TaxID=4072 RepID=A0A2G2ZT78_CAPAN|nr:hypothetical protein T459_07294 [Capsicum annuum]